MAYITYAKGFRAGGLNAYTNNSLYKSFDQETSDNYELGFKSTLLKNKLRFNISAFKIDWKDVQAYTVIDLATYQGAYVNAGSATSQGVEVELNVIPVKRLEFDFNLGYTDAKYNDLKAFDYSGFTEVNYKNKKVIYTPDITSMTALQYTIPFKIKEKMFGIKARGEYKYIGERYFTLDNKVKSDPYSLVNATLTFMSKYVEVSLWARNLADTKYLAFANAQSAFLAQPRMIGATLTAKF
jgi:iron complex outermembrane receptor protein